MDTLIIIPGVPNVSSSMYLAQGFLECGHSHYTDWQGVGVTWCISLATSYTHYRTTRDCFAPLKIIDACTSTATHNITNTIQ